MVQVSELYSHAAIDVFSILLEVVMALALEDIHHEQ